MNAVTGNSHLVRKIVFPTEILPIVYLVSATTIHVALLSVVLGIAFIYGYAPTMNMLALIYYYFAMGVFLVGLGWFLAGLHVFHRDVAQAMNVLINLWFWLTPIVWTVDMLPENLRWIPYANPMTYIVEGYRNAILYDVPFWANSGQGAFYWALACGVLLMGASVYRRLKPDFADVL